MSDRLQTTLLWLFVINLGVAFGAGIYEHRIVLPEWIKRSPDSPPRWDPQAALDADTGRRFWAFVTTGPLTLLALLNLWASSRARGSLRRWWLAASAAALTDRVVTFTYFIPTLLGLMRTGDSPASVEAAVRWSTLNYGRHAIVGASWLCSLKTFSLLYQQRGRPAGDQKSPGVM